MQRGHQTTFVHRLIHSTLHLFPHCVINLTDGWCNQLAIYISNWNTSNIPYYIWNSLINILTICWSYLFAKNIPEIECLVFYFLQSVKGVLWKVVLKRKDRGGQGAVNKVEINKGHLLCRSLSRLYRLTCDCEVLIATLWSLLVRK